LLQHRDLPFAHFARPFVSDPSGRDILSVYNELYKTANESVNAFIAANPDKLALHPVDGGDSPISYNLAMTTSGMAILPRRREGTMLRRDDGSDIGFVALNGTALGGTMMASTSATYMILETCANAPMFR
jgi:ATP adenylyltransferase